MGLTTAVYIQYTTVGLRPHVLPNVPLHVQKALWAVLIALSSCCFHASPLSKVSPRYVTSVDSWIL
jgi:hypothetical protein